VLENALEAQDVAKVYRGGATPALAGVELAIPRGSITAIVGPNGAGKSTLIKAWVGFERPTRGRVLVHGLDPFARRGDALARIGYIPQRPALYRDLTVADHVDLAASLRPTFDRALAARRLDDLAIPQGQLAGHLSGGQAAQVALALVLASGSDTLLLDEPLAALDPLARREFIYLLVAGVRDRGATAVMTSHIAVDVEQAADRLVVLNAGHKILDDEVEAARARHAIGDGEAIEVDGATRVASFLGLGEILTLFEIADGRPVGGRNDGLRMASLEEIMLGYLAAGRPGMVERVRAGIAGR
jgi:ABC-2 type transport system ATP-binding protein